MTAAEGSATSAADRHVRILSFVTHAPRPRNVDELIERALSLGVDVIAAQGTSNDYGAYWLGSGEQTDTRRSLKENIRPYMKAAVSRDIPFVLSVGLAGADIHLDEALCRVDELCEEEGWALRLGILSGEISTEFLLEACDSGVPITAAHEHPSLSPLLTVEDINDTIRAVALVGPEPIIEVLRNQVNGVITGRALDIGLHMAIPMMMGIPRHVAAHAGKIIECGAAAAEGGSAHAPIWAELDDDGFVVRSLDPVAPVTVRSVTAQAMYERSDPWLEVNPGGTLDLTQSSYIELERGVVRCEGARWIEAPYSVLVEGAKAAGHRSICIMGIRDSAVIENLDLLLEKMDAHLNTAPQLEGLTRGSDFELGVRVYGRDAVLGTYEPSPAIDGHEICLIIDTVAATRELAQQVCLIAYGRIQSGDFPGRLTTAGNVSLPFMPIVHPVGPVYRYSIFHILPLEDYGAPFRTWISDFPRSEGG
ncbi:MAG: acyclic terpene utilization AtuA family protein [Acidimicrobiales bacterium]